MKHSALKSGVAAAAVGAALAGAPLAAADDHDTAAAPTTTTIGQQAELVTGEVVQGWTIADLQPSSDAIPFTPRGTLWEATATDEAIAGSAQPVISNLNARASDGQEYRVLFGIATPQGVNPAPLAQGEKTTGKIYFDVVGAEPDTVVYNAGGTDLLVWRPAPPTPVATDGTWTPPAAGSPQSAPTQAAPETPATGSSGTPITEAAPQAESGSTGTPLTETAPTAPAPEAGSAGTPLTEAAPMAPAPEAGSAGTPVGESAPAIPEVPHGSQYLPKS